MDAEQALVQRLRRGNSAALDEAYRLHHARLWAFVARLCRHRADAEDVYQETWVALARHARGLDEDTRLLPWLFTVARRKHISMQRGWFTEVARRLGWGHEPRPGPTTGVEALEFRHDAAAVAACFSTLTDPTREVLLLCLVEELPTEQVAQILGLRQDAVRKRLSRARAELNAALAQPSNQGSRP